MSARKKAEEACVAAWEPGKANAALTACTVTAPKDAQIPADRIKADEKLREDLRRPRARRRQAARRRREVRRRPGEVLQGAPRRPQLRDPGHRRQELVRARGQACGRTQVDPDGWILEK